MPVRAKGCINSGACFHKSASGFTLIELVIGMVVFAIALSFFSSLILPQITRSVEPIFLVRATELAQSLLNEISGRAFDEQSSRNGSPLRCGESGAEVCTEPDNLGFDSGESRATFNDVDDYHGLNETGGGILSAGGGNDSNNLYQGYTANVSVVYDQNMDGHNDGTVGNSKLITVTVSTPNDEDLVFATYRSNF
ncbi:MAG: MSHA pilin protein MshD [Paraglaciecola sp.]|jgi:MSHA pilin protein MshD